MTNRLTVEQRIAGITESPTSIPTPPHEVRDDAHLANLVSSMSTHGWAGPPIVVDGDDALTGSHRIGAVIALLDEDLEIRVPRVDIAELCAVYGIDWAELVAEHAEMYGDALGFGGGIWSDPAKYAAATQVKYLLPADVAEYLGYDVDGA